MMRVASIDFRLFSNNVNNGCLWQRSHHMETRSALLTICMGNPTVTGVIPNIGPGQRLHILFDGSLNKLVQKLWRFQWFHTPWRSCDVTVMIIDQHYPSPRPRIFRSLLMGFIPDSEVHGANKGPTWVLSAPAGPMLALWTLLSMYSVT